MPNLKKSLVYTHNQLNRYKKIEKSIHKLTGNNNLPKVYEALVNLFTVVREQRIQNSFKCGYTSPKVYHTNQLQFSALKDCLTTYSDRFQDIEKDQIPYYELINRVFNNGKEFKFFFTKFVMILDGLEIDDISLCELFRSSNVSYSIFVLYLWTLIIYVLAGKSSSKQHIFDVKEQLKKLSNKLEKLACDIFGLRDQFMNKLDPYNTLPVIHYLRDIYTICEFFRDFAKVVNEIDKSKYEVDVSSSSQEDIMMNESKHDIINRPTDWSYIRFVIDKINCLKVTYGHNVKLKRRDLERIIDYLN